MSNAKAAAAKAKIQRRLATVSTEQLMEMAVTLNLQTTTEAILVANMIDCELEGRMTEAEFVAFMQLLEADMDAADAPAVKIHTPEADDADAGEGDWTDWNCKASPMHY